jgi:hypothetical protein
MNFQGETVIDFDVHGVVNSIFGDIEHAKRIKSVANAALGVISSGSLIVHRIGRGMAHALCLNDKHAVKQVDRLLSNAKLDVSKLSGNWIPFIIGSRKEAKIIMDWSDFDADGHTTLYLHLTTSHGRATPLLWKTFKKETLKNNRNEYEDKLLEQLKSHHFSGPGIL